MNNPHIIGFLIVTLLSISLLFLCIRKYRKQDPKTCILLSVTLIALYLYNGLSVYEPSIPIYYIFMYVVYVSVFYITFVLTYRKLNSRVNDVIDIKRETYFSRASFCKTVIFLYIVVNFVIIFLEGKTGSLIKVPELDVSVRFERFVSNSQTSYITILLGYINTMLKPLFYISLYYYRKKLIYVIPLILLPSYFTVVSTGYISRGGLLLPTIMIAFVIYLRIKKYRLLIIISSVAIAYLVIYYSFFISLYRRGMDLSNIDFTFALNSLILEEFNYPLHSEQIITYDKVAGITDYLLFVFTLPVPKVFINLHIEEYPILFSEYILGLDRTSSSFYILLPGCVLESYFIYGKYLFWIHPLTIAMISAYICKLSSRITCFSFFYLYLLLSFSWAISRAGFYSIIPIIVAPFYIFYWLYYYKSLRK